MTEKLNFIDYLSRQEQNLLVSLVELSSAFKYFKILDEIARQAIDKIDIPESKEVIGTLLVFVHSQFYFATSSVLRGNIAEGLSSTRRAIDATLSVYRIQDKPSEAKKYKKHHNKFVYIKHTIKAARKKDPTKYPLADLLIEMHEYCSQIASHADYSGIEPRLESRYKGMGKREQSYHYFDHSVDHDAYHRLFVNLLATFHQMYAVFLEFLIENFTDDIEQWKKAFGTIGAVLRKEIDNFKTNDNENG